MADPSAARVDFERSRRELEELLRGNDAQVVDMADRLSRATWEQVQQGTAPGKAVAAAMEQVGVAPTLQGLLGRTVVQALCAGAGIWPQVQVLPKAELSELSSNALRLRWDDSSFTLSQRLYGTTEGIRDEVAQNIKDALRRRDTAWDTARSIHDGYGFGSVIHAQALPDLPQDLDRLVRDARAALTPEDYAALVPRVERLKEYAAGLRTAPLRTAYAQVLGRIEKGTQKGLERAVRTATEEKARYHASRIQRTEAANAWGQGFQAQIDADEDVVGVRWVPSSAHKHFDICDFHARADLWGMGKGIYPKGKSPRFPAHPHCLCHLSPMYHGDKLPEPRDQIQKGGKDALRGMTDSERQRLLTIGGSDRFRGGADWRKDLRQWQEPQGMRPSEGAKKTLETVKEKVEAKSDWRNKPEELGFKMWRPGDPQLPFKGKEGISREEFEHFQQRFNDVGLRTS